MARVTLSVIRYHDAISCFPLFIVKNAQLQKIICRSEHSLQMVVFTYSSFTAFKRPRESCLNGLKARSSFECGVMKEGCEEEYSKTPFGVWRTRKKPSTLRNIYNTFDTIDSRALSAEGGTG